MTSADAGGRGSRPASSGNTRRPGPWFEAFVVFFGLSVGLGLSGLAVLVVLATAASIDSLALRNPIFVSNSPDGVHRVVVKKRPEWFGGFVDRRVELWLELESTTSGELVDQLIVGVERTSDIGMPAARWTADTAVLTGLERGHDMTATMQRARRRN